MAPLVVPWWRHGAMVALQQGHGGGMVDGGVAAASWWLHGHFVVLFKFWFIKIS